jgi:hypothetical protein
MLRTVLLFLFATLALGGCSTERETSPARTATEQLLVSSAADRAAERLALEIPEGTKAFVDSSYFEGTDSKYAVAAIRDSLLRKGVALVEKREKADAVVELRAGALSIDENDTLVGIRSFDIPIPLAGTFTLPEIALFKRVERKGVARFAATSYDNAQGSLIDSAPPKSGYSHKKEWTVLLFITWWTSDLPDEDKDDLLDQY